MANSYIGTYSGNVTVNTDIFSTLKTASGLTKNFRIWGFTLVCDASVEIELNDKSKIVTMPVGNVYIVNVEPPANGESTIITKLKFLGACSILAMNYYFDGTD